MPDAPTPNTAALLERTRVVEYTGGIQSAYCGLLLQQLGATVTAVEDPAGVPLREEPPFAPFGGGDSLLYHHLSAGKGRHTLDLASLADRKTFEALLEAADILVEDGEPRGPFARDLDPEAIRTRHPRLTVVSLSQFGRTGPYSGWRGNELAAQALGGIAYATGNPAKAPLKLAGNPFQYAAAIAGVLGATTALLDRHRTGEGRHVDVSTFEFIAGNQELATLYTWLGLVRKRAFPSMAPFVEYSLHPCQDGYVDLGTSMTGFQDGIAALLDRPELATDERFATTLGLFLNHDALSEYIRDSFATRTRDEIFHTAMQRRFLCGPVLTAAEVQTNPHLEARGFWEPGAAGAPKRPGSAIRFFPAAPLPSPESLSPTEPVTLSLSKGNPEAHEVATPEPAIRLNPAHSDAIQVPAPASSRGDRLLAGVRVIDWTLAYAGPVAGRYLAELGADVIRLSSVQFPARATGSALWPDNDPGEEPWNREGYSTDRFMGKREVTINISDPAGRELLFRLLETADVLLENHSPRALKNLALTYEDVAARVPGIIMVSLSAFGQDGPWAGYSATGDVLEAAGGGCDATGYPGGPPERCGMVYLDTFAGTYAAAATVAALEHRARTSLGGYINTSMFEAAVATFPESALAAAAGSEYPTRTANAHPSYAPHGVYPTHGDDQWIAVAADSDIAFRALATNLDRAEWATDERFATPAARMAHRDALDTEIGYATVEHHKWRLTRVLQSAGVIAAPVLDMREALLDPHLWQRGLLQMVDHPGFGDRAWERQFPGRISGADLTIPRPAPKLGEHNDPILGGELGLTPAELAALRESNVIGERPLWSDAPMQLDREQAQHYAGIREWDPQYREHLAQAARAASRPY